MSKSTNTQKRFPGSFVVARGIEVTGELRIKGERTLLTVRASEKLPFLENSATVLGRSYTGRYLTMVDCVSAGSWTSFSDDPSLRLTHQASYFPHYVVFGDRHLQPDVPSIHAVYFGTTDLETVIYDFDAFSHLNDASDHIDAVLAERRKTRHIETGEYPQIAYFTGKMKVAEVETNLGRISFNHRPMSNMGGPKGVFIKNRVNVSIHFGEPKTFDQAIRAMTDIAGFLAIAAGRTQGIKQVQLETEDMTSPSQILPLTVVPSFKWKVEDDELFKPHAGDVPLDPIRHPEEFAKVFSAWVNRHEEWRAARSTSLSCLGKGNTYEANRLTAAANMFDLLPRSAVALSSELSTEMQKAKAECMAILRKLEKTVDRDSALDALGRVGKPSLTKKALHRVAIVSSQTAGRFPELELVVRVAVKCRNYLVHGSENTEFVKLSPHFAFMTDALEFSFTISDLIECGWSPARWISSGKGNGHSFSRFWLNYRSQLAKLKMTLDELKSIN